MLQIFSIPVKKSILMFCVAIIEYFDFILHILDKAIYGCINCLMAVEL